jgi:hypothetical protein
MKTGTKQLRVRRAGNLTQTAKPNQIHPGNLSTKSDQIRLNPSIKKIPPGLSFPCRAAWFLHSPFFLLHSISLSRNACQPMPAAAAGVSQRETQPVRHRFSDGGNSKPETISPPNSLSLNPGSTQSHQVAPPYRQGLWPLDFGLWTLSLRTPIPKTKEYRRSAKMTILPPVCYPIYGH